MQEFLAKVIDIATNAGGKIILAIIVFIIGKIVIGKLLKLIGKARSFKKMDETAYKFILKLIKAVLYIVLVVSIIGILGVPMASVVAVIASAGVAVGLALQGSLSNLAGGLMLMIFRPFNVGDFIIAAGEEGVVQEISLFYTIILTTDNKRVTIPNGTLMNSNISNASCEETRRVDLTFGCAKGESIEKVTSVMLDIMNKNDLVLKDPEPFAKLSGGSNESMEFTARAWTLSENYWDTYFSLTEQITEALGNEGIKAPAVRVVSQ